MGIYINDKSLVIISSPISIRFDLPIKSKKGVKHENKFIIIHNKSLAECAIANYCSDVSLKMIFMNMQNSSLKLLAKKNWVIYLI